MIARTARPFHRRHRVVRAEGQLRIEFLPIADDVEQAYVLDKTSERFVQEPQTTIGQSIVWVDPWIGRWRKRRVSVPCRKEKLQEHQHAELGCRDRS